MSLLALLLSLVPQAAVDLPRIERLDPRFDALVPPGATLTKVADGFGWAEGPLWHAATDELFFSDVVKNRLHAWSERAGTRVVLERSG